MNRTLVIYYTGMDKHGGLQMSGTAEIVDPISEDYTKVIQCKGISMDKILSLPVNLNMIRIKLKKAEFLWSELGKLGYDVKQNYEFTQQG